MNEHFRLKSIAEFLDGKHSFFIPSYQRGYRWEKSQVEDLLKDIWDFASKASKGDFYCLQPIVVKQKEDSSSEWVVVDGQQRLTTLLLLLNYLRQGSPDSLPGSNYTISYQTRPKLDFTNIKELADIDSYYAYGAKSIIEQWFKENLHVRKGKMQDVLFYGVSDLNEAKNAEPQVKVIWYVVQEESETQDAEAIKIFNNLNRGKIRLTNAELIKSLFVLRCREKEEPLAMSDFAYQWNEIENTLHDPKFWSFISNREYTTRIDLIFDFIAGKELNDDEDFSYRRFQELYDNTEGAGSEFWKKKELSNFTQVWQRVMETFSTFKYWFENNELYHYIGYLICNDVSLLDIFSKCNKTLKGNVALAMQLLIKEKVLSALKNGEADIDTIVYGSPLCKPILLLFNIVTYAQSSYRFPFDLYKVEKWDIEHIDSQTTNPLVEVRDKIVWLSYMEKLHFDDSKWSDLQAKAAELKDELEKQKKDQGKKFDGLYKEILAVVQDRDNRMESDAEEKDAIGNLALLDASTNRSYGNALFPTKRQTIIQKDAEGGFIPMCTKNLFLKYYSKQDNQSSQWKNKWNEQDAKAYLEAIHEKVDHLFKLENNVE